MVESTSATPLPNPLASLREAQSDVGAAVYSGSQSVADHGLPRDAAITVARTGRYLGDGPSVRGASGVPVGG